MRTLQFFTLTFAVSALFTLPAKAQDAIDSTAKLVGYYLDFSGIMTINGEKVSDYTVYIYKDGELADSVFVENRREQFFELALYHDYAIKFCKSGYKERVILVDTHLPEKFHLTYFTFRYEIEFIPEDESNTFDDFPVAYITYDKRKRDFDYNRTYHNNVRMQPAATRNQTASK